MIKVYRRLPMEDLAKYIYARPKAALSRKKVQILYETQDQRLDFNKESKEQLQERVLLQIQQIEEMRAGKDAPVDSMGCDLHTCASSAANDQAFQMLVSLILSVQTKDEITHMLMQRLFSRFDQDMHIRHIYELDPLELKTLIQETNYNGQKVKYIKAAAQDIIENREGVMPSTLEEIVKFKGVGNKIGILVMQSFYKQNVGIAVDTHVHKVANRLGWVKTKDPESTRQALERVVPKERWRRVNHQLVGFGQTICKTSPLCQDCLCRPSCPYTPPSKTKSKK